jgi:EpsI family protein
MREWRKFLPAAVLGVGCLLIAGARSQERVPLKSPLREIPLRVTGFAGDDRVIPDDERKVAGMTDYLFRVFVGDARNAFSVYVGYYDSQATGRTIHSPRNCLPGAGWQAVESGTRTVAVHGRNVTVNRYILANGTAQALVYYWYQGRGRVAWSEYRVKWDLLRDAALSGRTEEALVRIMVPIPPSRGFTEAEWKARQASADALASRVAAELVPAVERSLPTWTAPVT